MPRIVPSALHRSVVVSTRMHPSERDAVAEHARRCGIALSVYIRHSALGASLPPVPSMPRVPADFLQALYVAHSATIALAHEVQRGVLWIHTTRYARLDKPQTQALLEQLAQRAATIESALVLLIADAERRGG